MSLVQIVISLAFDTMSIACKETQTTSLTVLLSGSIDSLVFFSLVSFSWLKMVPDSIIGRCGLLLQNARREVRCIFALFGAWQSSLWHRMAALRH
jgi:hypothetical protein